MARVDTPIGVPAAANYTGSGTNYVIRTSGGVYYFVYVDSLTSDISYVKSSDGGVTWANPVVIMAGTYVSCSVWFDPWSGLAGGLIHACGTNSADSDIDYRTVNTASADALGTQRVAFAGTSSAANPGGLSICVAQGGNIYIAYNIDSGTEHGMRRTVDGGANWTTRATPTEAADDDVFVMQPGQAADNQDMLCLYWDISASAISVKIYDNSADSWSEIADAGTYTPLAPSTAWPNMASVCVLGSGLCAAVVWNATDAANADLISFSFNEFSINPLGQVVLNSADDQGLCALSIDPAFNITAFYCGASAGGETWNSSMNVYCKTSSDIVTWGTETKLTNAPLAKNALFANPLPPNTGEFSIAYCVGANALVANVEMPVVTGDTRVVLVNNTNVVS